MAAQTRVGIKDGSQEKKKFIFTIDTTQPGSTASDTFKLPAGFITGGVYNATIEWGDGTTSLITSTGDSDLTHVYSTPGIYTVKILGSFPYIRFNSGGDRLKMMSINQWGTNKWLSMQYAYSKCSNLEVYATDKPDLSLCTNMSAAFFQCSSLTSIDLSNCITSTTTVIGGLFAYCTSLTTVNLSGNDVSSVTTFGGMFTSCNSLTTIDLTGFNVSSVCTSLPGFTSCSSLTSLDVSGWDTTGVSVYGGIFQGMGYCDIVGIDTWNVENVTNFGNFMYGSSISTIEYDKILVAWNNQNLPIGKSIYFGTSKYTIGSTAQTARQNIINTKSWTITDGGGI
jgi:surface protein